jgi:hypothetical protein
MAVVPAILLMRVGREVNRARELGSYRLVRLLGKGGMGEVWRAEHRMLARPADIKLIRPDTIPADSAEASRVLQRFEREAQATARLQSPHSIELYDFGMTNEGAFYYVMELLEGMDLKTLVQRFGPLPAGRAVSLLAQACDSLADAHHLGLVHRDVKPANLYACRKGLLVDFVKVLDFGLVITARDQPGEDMRLTRAGSATGTPSFMAPEMVVSHGELDGRADVYALGCVAYYLLTGKPGAGASLPAGGGGGPRRSGAHHPGLSPEEARGAAPEHGGAQGDAGGSAEGRLGSGDRPAMVGRSPPRRRGTISFRGVRADLGGAGLIRRGPTGTRETVAISALGAAVMIAQQTGGKATRDALFLTHFEITSLPVMISAAALVSFVVVLATGRLLARAGPARTVPLGFLASGILLLGEWVLLGVSPRAASVLPTCT